MTAIGSQGWLPAAVRGAVTCAGTGRLPYPQPKAGFSAAARRRPPLAAPPSPLLRCRPQRFTPDRPGWLPGLAPKAPSLTTAGRRW